jgi:hypothetical protein
MLISMQQNSFRASLALAKRVAGLLLCTAFAAVCASIAPQCLKRHDHQLSTLISSPPLLLKAGVISLVNTHGGASTLATYVPCICDRRLSIRGGSKDQGNSLELRPERSKDIVGETRVDDEQTIQDALVRKKRLSTSMPVLFFPGLLRVSFYGLIASWISNPRKQRCCDALQTWTLESNISARDRKHKETQHAILQYVLKLLVFMRSWFASYAK